MKHTIKVKGRERERHRKSSDHVENILICNSHLSVLQLHIQEVKVSENPELLLTGSVI